MWCISRLKCFLRSLPTIPNCTLSSQQPPDEELDGSKALKSIFLPFKMMSVPHTYVH